MDPNDVRPRRDDRILAQQSDESWVLLDPEDGSYYALDGLAGRVWELCDGGHSVDAIATTLADEYDAPVAIIAADVRQFVADLRASRLLAPA